MNITGVNHITNFKGLWGEQKFLESKDLYGGEVTVNYFTQKYHPFADETQKDIRDAVRRKDHELNKCDDYGAGYMEHTKFEIGKRLQMTTDMYDDICEGRMNDKLPLLDTKA